jgi:flagellar assembly protein FliH
MMSISFSEEVKPVIRAEFSSFAYRDINAPALSKTDEALRVESQAGEVHIQQMEDGVSQQAARDAISLARTDAVTETEARLRNEYEARSAAEASKVVKALESFQEKQKQYFTSVESDVIQLALAIAAKILHREAQIDPMLVAALVRVAVEKLHDVSSVTVRVAPANVDKWRTYLSKLQNGSVIAVVDDAQLEPDDCVLETSLGSANFSIDAQLKEVEQGFFDLLAQRPVIK